MPQCRSCGAAILWLTMRESGRKMPVDAKPVNAVVRVDGRGVRADDGEMGVMVKAYTPHWATCPNASDHKKGE
jgi:hypothetical protein